MYTIVDLATAKKAVSDTYSIQADHRVGCDTETYNSTGGLYGKVRLVSLYMRGWETALLLDLYNNDITEVYDWLCTLKIVGANFTYDRVTFQSHAGKVNEWTDVVDVQLWAKYLWCLVHPQGEIDRTGRFGVYNLCDIVYDLNPYDQLSDGKGNQKINWAMPLTDENYRYSALDAIVMLDIHDSLVTTYNSLTNEQKVGFNTWYTTALIADEMSDRMSHEGLYFHLDNTAQYILDCREQSENARKELINTYGWDSKMRAGQTSKAKEKLGLPATNKTVLARAEYEGNVEAGLFREWRGKAKRAEDMAKRLQLSMIRPTKGNLIGHFRADTSTGRWACKQDNLQNLPRDSKSLFVAPKAGEKVLAFDYAQVELRTACTLFPIPAMAQAFRDGVDIHTETQNRCALPSRTYAKAVNFGLLYGAGPATLSDIMLDYGVYMDVAEAGAIKGTFMQAYEGISDYHDRGSHKSKWVEANYAFLGRGYYSPLFSTMNNRANQASGGDVLKIFLFLAKEEGLVDGLKGCRIGISVHDSVVMYLSVGFDHRAIAEEIAYLVNKSWFVALSFGKKLGHVHYTDIPMPVVVGVGDSWGDCDGGNPDFTIELEGMEAYQEVKDEYGYL